MTRWDIDDLAGRLLKREGRAEEGGKWKVVHLPAIAGPGDALGRAPGAPLPHPKIDPADVEGAAAHWAAKRDGSLPHDWAALYQGDPVAASGALLTQRILDRQRVEHGGRLPRPVVAAVSVDPSGGGGDEAGVVAGFLGADHRIYITNDDSGVMGPEQWARAAVLLAAHTNADRIIMESNYGGSMPRNMINLAGASLKKEGRIRKDALTPYLQDVHASRSKRQRAEPVAQMLYEDLVRLAGRFPELETQWTTWTPTSRESPGRLDAMVHLCTKLAPYIPR